MGRWAKKNQQYTLDKDMDKVLREKYNAARGRSRHADKQAGVDWDYIYSTNTLNTYRQSAAAYRTWLKATHPEVKHLRSARQYVNKYLEMLTSRFEEGIGSAWTISTRKSALVKIFDLDPDGLIETPSRHRDDIKRNRTESEYSKRISPERKEYFGMMGRCTGMRRDEMTHVIGTDLRQDQHGAYYLHLDKGTKGGKIRDAYLNGTAEQIQKIVETFTFAGENKVFPRVPHTFVEHTWRRKYAQDMYNKYARPVHDIPKKDRYICRGEHAGVVLDRKALMIVARDMGHSRPDVVVTHYLFD